MNNLASFEIAIKDNLKGLPNLISATVTNVENPKEVNN
jgi:hypothetical protein